MIQRFISLLQFSSFLLAGTAGLWSALVGKAIAKLPPGTNGHTRLSCMQTGTFMLSTLILALSWAIFLCGTHVGASGPHFAAKLVGIGAAAGSVWALTLAMLPLLVAKPLNGNGSNA